MNGKGLLESLKFNAKKVEIEGEGVEWLPSPSLALNVATGGGIPLGRLIEFYGDYSSGKSTAAYELVGMAHKLNGFGCIVDAEMVYDPKFGANLGINNEELIVYPGDTKTKANQDEKKEEIRARSVERVSAFLEDLVTKIRNHYDYDLPALIVVDSISGLTTMKEAEDDMDKSSKDLTKAQKLGLMYNRLVGICKKYKVSIIFINQLREKIGASQWEPKETTSGGKGLEFFASLRVRFKKGGRSDASIGLKSGVFLDQNEIKIGQLSYIEITKNKVYPPFNTGEIMFHFDRFEDYWGTDRYFGLVEFLKKERIFTMAGSWYCVGNDKIANGSEATQKALEDNPELVQDIFNKLGIKFMDL